MTQKETKHNTLNLSEISKINSPSHLSVADNKEEAGGVRTSLLHQAFAPCGRAFLCLFFGLMLFLGVGCSKDVADVAPLTPVHQMYNESRGLPSTSIDSVKTFTIKFSNYLKNNPDGLNDEYCNPTLEYLKYACSVFGYKLKVTTVAFRFNTGWGEAPTIYFD